MEADVVIVGAGAAGIGAAITLADAGKKVILLEKGDKYGGAGMFGAQGLFAVESDQQKAAGEHYTIKQAYQELATYGHYRTNLSLTKSILQQSASTISWLDDHGLKTELVANTQEAHQHHPRVYHQYIDKFAGFKRLIRHYQTHGGQLLLNTAGEEILQSGHEIIGVKAKHEEKEFIINCSVVIVADGGFIGNAKMVKKYLSIDPDNLYSMGERKATGDGIRMLAQLGADTRHLGIFENHAASVVSPENHRWHNDTIFSLTNLPFLWVDHAGKRFVDESVCYDFALWGNATYAAGGFYYILLDQRFVDFISNHELNWTDAFERTFKSLAHQQTSHTVGPFSQIDVDLEEAIEMKAAWKAENVADLAMQLHVPATNLRATITRYNSLIKNHADKDFYKPANFLRFPLVQGPFYALKAKSTSLGTIGGIETNEKLEALTAEKTPILGAFVAGNDASGMYDTSYPTLEGISCAFAWNSGRIAGKSAIAFLQKVSSDSVKF